MKKKKIVLLVLLAGIIAAEASVVVFAHGDLRLRRYTGQILRTCSAASYRPVCYDREIPKLLDRISMEDAFAVARLVQDADPVYLSCHVLGHAISYHEVEKRPEAWKDVMTRCPQAMCNNGCLHGALMRRYNNAVFTPDEYPEVVSELTDVCEPRGSWKPTEMERSMCYHAIGHLVMYVTEADVSGSVAMCQTIGTKADGRNYVQTCTEGVFMTIFQPLEPEDYALIRNVAPNKETAKHFCAGFAGMSYHACMRETWPLFVQELDQPEGLVSFCSYADDRVAQQTCVGAMMNHLTESLIVRQGGSVGPLRIFCDALPDLPKHWCFGSAATRLVQLDPLYADLAISVCAIAQEEGVGEYCWQGLADYGGFNFSPRSREGRRFCASLPDPFGKECVKKNDAYGL